MSFYASPSKKIAVITSGGDAPGMNACIRSITQAARHAGYTLTGFKHGYKGIVEQLAVPLHLRDMRLITQQGGTLLKSARYPEFKQPEIQKLASQQLTQQGFDALIVIGGDGSLHGAHALSQYWDRPIICLPGTIDNDIAGTDLSIGFSTAVDTAVEAIDRIRETAEAMARIFVIEVMGRHAGFIGLHAALASAAEAMLIPEMSPLPNLNELTQNILTHHQHFPDNSYLMVLSENLWPGGSAQLAHDLGQQTGIACHATVLGHLQRGGRPNTQDRILATLLGEAAIRHFVQGGGHTFIGMQGEDVCLTPLHQTFGKKKEISTQLLKLQLSLQ